VLSVKLFLLAASAWLAAGVLILVLNVLLGVRAMAEANFVQVLWFLPLAVWCIRSCRWMARQMQMMGRR
jgi:Gpi18-like mannosyltransferase